MIGLDEVGALLTNHVDGILDATVRNDRENRRINDPDVLQPMHLEFSISHALFNLLREAAASTWVCVTVVSQVSDRVLYSGTVP